VLVRGAIESSSSVLIGPRDDLMRFLERKMCGNDVGEYVTTSDSVRGRDVG